MSGGAVHTVPKTTGGSTRSRARARRPAGSRPRTKRSRPAGPGEAPGDGARRPQRGRHDRRADQLRLAAPRGPINGKGLPVGEPFPNAHWRNARNTVRGASAPLQLAAFGGFGMARFAARGGLRASAIPLTSIIRPTSPARHSTRRWSPFARERRAAMRRHRRPVESMNPRARRSRMTLISLSIARRSRSSNAVALARSISPSTLTVRVPSSKSSSMAVSFMAAAGTGASLDSRTVMRSREDSRTPVSRRMSLAWPPGARIRNWSPFREIGARRERAPAGRSSR